MDHAVLLQFAELQGEHALGDARQEFTQFAETPGAGKEMVEHHALPAASDDLQGDFDRAIVGASLDGDCAHRSCL